MLKEGQNVSGLKKQIKRHREKVVVVAAKSSWEKNSSVEKPDIDLMSVNKGWREIVWQMRNRKLELPVRICWNRSREIPFCSEES